MVDSKHGATRRGHPHLFGIEFAQELFKPGSVSTDFVDAEEFEVRQFLDAQSAGPLDAQSQGGQLVGVVGGQLVAGSGRRRRGCSAAVWKGSM